MTTTHYLAKARDNRVLELPEEAQALGLQPGEEVSVTLNRNADKQTIQPDEGMLAALREIAERQKGRRYTDGSETDRMMREGRAGAMWGHEPTK